MANDLRWSSSIELDEDAKWKKIVNTKLSDRYVKESEIHFIAAIIIIIIIIIFSAIRRWYSASGCCVSTQFVVVVDA